jgi:hypothetical protein
MMGWMGWVGTRCMKASGGDLIYTVCFLERERVQWDLATLYVCMHAFLSLLILLLLLPLFFSLSIFFLFFF